MRCFIDYARFRALLDTIMGVFSGVTVSNPQVKFILENISFKCFNLVNIKNFILIEYIGAVWFLKLYIGIIRTAYLQSR